MAEEKVAKTNVDLNRAFKPDREVIQVGGEAVYIAELSAEDALSLTTGDG